MNSLIFVCVIMLGDVCNFIMDESVLYWLNKYFVNKCNVCR